MAIRIGGVQVRARIAFLGAPGGVPDGGRAPRTPRSVGPARRGWAVLSRSQPRIRRRTPRRS